MFIGMGFGASSSGYIANAVNFDGTNDYLTNSGAFTGASDSKVFSYSAYIYRNANGEMLLSKSSDGGVQVGFNSANEFEVILSSGVGIILNASVASLIPLSTWTHVGVSVDLSNPSNRVITFDGIAQTVDWSTYTDENINYSTISDHAIGANSAGTNKFNGFMAEHWENHGGSFVDFSDNDIYRKFVLNGKPRELGATGSLPTGTSPNIFLSGATNSWHTNKGTGGGFAEVGELTTAATSPSD